MNFESARWLYHNCYLPTYYEEGYDGEDHEGERVSDTDLEFELTIAHTCVALVYYHEGFQYAKEAVFNYLDQCIGMDFPTEAWGEVHGYRWNLKHVGPPERRLAFEAAELIHNSAGKIQSKYRERLAHRMKKRVLVHHVAPYQDISRAISLFL